MTNVVAHISPPAASPLLNSNCAHSLSTMKILATLMSTYGNKCRVGCADDLYKADYQEI